ncbi:uncharacterized protein B0I36DRAFT_119423 [Microdochium trichocladiopsis]|uniref:Secreted protein n=1 Tax=Microdochium trichocladiopsis TaxID=1682393 RepID=A0A9P8Y4S2_9PEZI|nr:uncharacterized protein B0I36DRAFT_119423 [Microdochium trichocladiopsis]KAH7031177.1 hypothetical protein B0I36DRAFT_119423 [Microdochium trichocladiopsis]
MSREATVWSSCLGLAAILASSACLRGAAVGRPYERLRGARTRQRFCTSWQTWMSQDLGVDAVSPCADMRLARVP